MIIFSQKVSQETQADHKVKLAFHQRVKGRLRITTEDGLEAGIVTTRGNELIPGEKLKDDLGSVLEVLALAESVSVATTDSPLLFSRACYHLGNRHTEVQIESDQLIYLHDHVLDSMLIQLGLEVTRQTLPFSPENGAYHGAGAHAHTHAHVHTNEASSGQ